ncbi:MAG: HU family DNA-binding protein [Gammaproteobacteria bacterium]|nr:HU family DNA-binding protein [Gammaproteobacteria bacterium]
MSAQTGLTEDQADDFINTIMGYGGNDPIVRKKPGRTMVGFGSFSISKRAARVGRNPQTGKEIQIKAKNVVKFKAGSDLSGKVN